MRYFNPQRFVLVVLEVPVGIVAALALLALGCSAPESSEPVAEPTSALRPPAERGAIPPNVRLADYDLEVKLDEVEHRVEGVARVTWTNSSQEDVDNLAFHLYMNGFRAEDTAWMTTSGGTHRANKQKVEGAWGHIEINSVRMGDVPSATSEELTLPKELPWREGEDPSTMTVDLPVPVAPGASVSVELEFETQLPKVIARTGYFEDFHAVGQWYPKLAVFENGAWQNHVFTYHDEFFADFGNYRVELDVPADMVVGATGIRTAEENVGDRALLTYEAEMVHDFVWMGDPEFVEHFGEYQGIRIRQLMRPEILGDAAAHLEIQKGSLESYERRFGPYPWSTITIVHPPDGAEGAGGMEYPTFFTTGRMPAIPEWFRASVADNRVGGLFTTIHEFGHQYFQGMFAIREHLEPWLDEGMNTTSNLLAVQDIFADDPWIFRLLDHKVYVGDLLRRGIRRRAFLEPLEGPAADFNGLIGNYGATVYGRTAAVMLTLRNIVGADAFDRALREFSDEQRFLHPRGSDLEASLVSGIGERVNLAAEGERPVWFDVGTFLDRALRTTEQADVAILRVMNRRLPGRAGWHRDETGLLVGGEPPANLEIAVADLEDEQTLAIVTLHRPGGLIVPVDVEVEFESGRVADFVWDAAEPTAVYKWPGERARRATLDPDGKILLEWNQLDNSAFARNAKDKDDGLSRPMRVFAEALSYFVMGAVGP